MPVVIGIIIAILILGSLAAIIWWNISAKAAPYADESEKDRRRREEAERRERANTVVIDSPRSDPRPRP